MGVVPSIASPIALHCDSTRAIAQAIEPRSHRKSKHVLWKFHLITEIIQRNEIVIEKIPSEDNVADPLTKEMPQDKHESHTRSRGLRTQTDWL